MPATPPPRPPQPPSAGWRGAPMHFVRGLLMGTADVIPGVSGGTMALIVGIYERLVEAIRRALGAPALLLTGRPRQALADLRAVEWSLVIPLALGIGTAIIAASAVIPGLLARHPVEMRGLFFGLIAASILIPWRALRRPGAREAVVAVAAAAAAFFLVGLPALATATDPGLLRVFLTAAVAICAMILPGVSGAFFLLVLGLYEPTLHALRTRDLPYVAVFILGALVGLGLFSRLLTWLLARHHDATMAALIGLMAGSLRALWPWQGEARVLLPPGEGLPVAVGLAVLGAAAVLALAWLGARAARTREPAHEPRAD